MIVTLKNQQGVETRYMVTWKHANPAAPTRLLKLNDGPITINARSTKCMIWKITGESPDPEREGKVILQKELIATGEAKCSAKDCFCKETGRKVSMQRALNQGRTEIAKATKLKFINMAKFFEDGLFKYDDRVVFWDTYFARKPAHVELILTEEQTEILMTVIMDKANDIVKEIGEKIEKRAETV